MCQTHVIRVLEGAEYGGSEEMVWSFTSLSKHFIIMGVSAALKHMMVDVLVTGNVLKMSISMRASWSAHLSTPPGMLGISHVDIQCFLTWVKTSFYFIVLLLLSSPADIQKNLLSSLQSWRSSSSTLSTS